MTSFDLDGLSISAMAACLSSPELARAFTNESFELVVHRRQIWKLMLPCDHRD